MFRLTYKDGTFEEYSVYDHHDAIYHAIDREKETGKQIGEIWLISPASGANVAKIL